MRPLTTLHLASFVGNLGDSAMHDGEYRTRVADLPVVLDHRPCEVRDFIHWGRRVFDDTFVAEANSCDLVVIGGFSLFQLWRDSTVSGTYLDVSADLFGKIRSPVLFHGLGCDATRGVSALAVSRTRAFLDRLLGFDHCRFSLRNDGTGDLIRAHLGDRYVEAMDIVPDGGLFACPDGTRVMGREEGRRVLAINLAGDMPDKRFRDAGGSDHLDRFAREMAAGIEALLGDEDDLTCVFVPHIYSDFGPISAVLSVLDDRLRRSRVSVAGLDQDVAGWMPAFEIYRRAAAVISMRYHASLGSIGFETPVYGISTHHKIEGQFKAYGLVDRCLNWDGSGNLARVFETIGRDLVDPVPTTRRLAKVSADERKVLKAYHDDLAGWLAERVRAGG